MKNLVLVFCVTVLFTVGCGERKNKAVVHFEPAAPPKQTTKQSVAKTKLELAKKEEEAARAAKEQERVEEEKQRKEAKAAKDKQVAVGSMEMDKKHIEDVQKYWAMYASLVDKVAWPHKNLRNGDKLTLSKEQQEANKVLLAKVRADGLTDHQRYDAEMDRRAKSRDNGVKTEWQDWLKQARAEMARRQKEVDATPPTFTLDAWPDVFGTIRISKDGNSIGVYTKGGLRMAESSAIWDLLRKEEVSAGHGLDDLVFKGKNYRGVKRLSADSRFEIVKEDNGLIVLYRTNDKEKLWSGRYGTEMMRRRWGDSDAAELRLSGNWLGDMDVAHHNGVVTVVAYGGKYDPAGFEKNYLPNGTVKVWVLNMTQK